MNDTGFARIKNVLKEIPFFEDFSDEELDYFSRQSSLRSVPGDTILFKQGEIGDYLFFVVKGNVDIRIGSTDSRRVVASFGYGSSVGEMSLIDEYPRSATVLVTEPSELLIFTKNRFEAMNEENPKIGLKILKGLLKNLSIRLRSMSGRFADII